MNVDPSISQLDTMVTIEALALGVNIVPIPYAHIFNLSEGAGIFFEKGSKQFTILSGNTGFSAYLIRAEYTCINR